MDMIDAPATQTVPHRSVAIVGAGFSGLMAALHLLRMPDGPKVMLIDRRTPFAMGAAFSTGNSDHVLNVRAGNMSAWPDQPLHFVAWLASETGTPPREDMFATRGQYGRYLQGLLTAQMETTAAGRLFVVADEVSDAVRDADGGWWIELGVGRRHRVDAIILALGNPPPAPPPYVDAELTALRRYVGDPWNWTPIARDRDDGGQAPSLLIGTGLTMVDVALACLRAEPERPLIALSRRGLMPQSHEGPPPHQLLAPPPGLSPARLSQRLRQAGTQIGWRAAVDSVRPSTQEIWSRWSHAQRASFLRHGRAYWDIHRHRLSPAIAQRVRTMMDSGQLTVAAGRIRSLEACGDDVICRWTPRGESRVREIPVSRVVNCTGPSGDLGALSEPLLVRMKDRGDISADALGLGIDADAEGRLIGRDGAVRPGLFGLGPVTRGALWEIVAVPDIRVQAPKVAARAAAIPRA
jgi:uncharacterized NAD(P)/FAD-binding protein YdhS